MNQLTTQSLSTNSSTPLGCVGDEHTHAERNVLLIKKALEDARGAKKVGALHVVAGRRVNSVPMSATGVTLSLNSLDMRKPLSNPN